MVDFKLTHEEAFEPIDSLLKKWDIKYNGILNLELKL